MPRRQCHCKCPPCWNLKWSRCIGNRGFKLNSNKVHTNVQNGLRSAHLYSIYRGMRYGHIEVWLRETTSIPLLFPVRLPGEHDIARSPMSMEPSAGAQQRGIPSGRSDRVNQPWDAAGQLWKSRGLKSIIVENHLT
jgi:hypothetical protein